MTSLRYPFPSRFSAASASPTRPTRKRDLDPINPYRTNKTLRLTHGTNKSPRDLVLNARDSIVQTYNLSKSREEQSKLLDLLEIN